MAMDAPTKSKSLFKSKSFWFNVLGVAVTVASGGVAGVTIPSSVAVPILTVGNVLIRLFSTTGPAHIVE